MQLIDYIKTYESLKSKLEQLEIEFKKYSEASPIIAEAVQKEMDHLRAEIVRMEEQKLYTQSYVDQLKYEINNPWK